VTRPDTLVALVPLLLGALAPTTAVGQGSTPTSGYRAEFFQLLDVEQAHYIALAEAMPESTYGWRPGEGVRSVGEVYLHVAVANFIGPTMVGVPLPEGFQPEGYEQSTTSKSEIVARLRGSFEHLRAAVLSMSDAAADTSTDGFYGPTTYRGVLSMINEHLGEHLGQSIAYARVNGVVPPWSN
jgi:uncharacterized damage-inducible protein DinB